MTTRTTYSIMCDDCGETAGHSHNESTARHEVRGVGWVRIRNGKGELIDLCIHCAEHYAKQQEAQP